MPQSCIVGFIQFKEKIVGRGETGHGIQKGDLMFTTQSFQKTNKGIPTPCGPCIDMADNEAGFWSQEVSDLEKIGLYLFVALGIDLKDLRVLTSILGFCENVVGVEALVGIG
jgi:hypothetical protein